MSKFEIDNFVKNEKLKIIEALQKEHLDFELDETQIKALLKVIEIITKDEFDFVTLSGSAGTGKTQITKLVTRYLEQVSIPYLLATPTNKACGVLSQTTQRDTITLHKLLSLKPTINILELDFKDLKFSSNSFSSGIPNNGVLIVDECSMINKELFKFIIDKCEHQNSRILFLGDSLQLYPVKEATLSQPFLQGHQVVLTKIFRQKGDNPILDVLSELRTHCMRKFKVIKSESGNLSIYDN
jgi:ATP-dependent exoDNAse (exonuclease V) alpha subunit